ncbi:MAG: hypothetical protein U0587_07050 [Candidatus Binatia bacterium]
MYKRSCSTLAAGIMCFVLGAPWQPGAASAQTGGGYDLRLNTIDGGGGTFSTAASYALGGTVGQGDAGRLTGGTYALNGGFWFALRAQTSPTPTATVPGTASPTSARSSTPSFTSTATPPRTATPTGTFAPVVTPTLTLPVPPTATPTAVSTPRCTGDCRNDGAVTIDELLQMLDIALGTRLATDCLAGDADGNDEITIGEILTAVKYALEGCPAARAGPEIAIVGASS